MPIALMGGSDETLTHVAVFSPPRQREAPEIRTANQKGATSVLTSSPSSAAAQKLDYTNSQEPRLLMLGTKETDCYATVKVSTNAVPSHDLTCTQSGCIRYVDEEGKLS